LAVKDGDITNRKEDGEKLWLWQSVGIGRYENVIVPKCMVGNFSRNLLCLGRGKNYIQLGLESFPTIFGTVIENVFTRLPVFERGDSNFTKPQAVK
jgi:hypothetical protein